MAVDGGSVVHMCSELGTPGYGLGVSADSRSEQTNLFGDGDTISNRGQKALNLEGGDRNIQSVFRIAAVIHR